MFRARKLVSLSMLAISLSLQACGNSSLPPPVLQTNTIKIVPPASLLDYPPPPDAAAIADRDGERQLLLDMTAWAMEMKARLDALKAWEAKQ